MICVNVRVRILLDAITQFGVRSHCTSLYVCDDRKRNSQCVQLSRFGQKTDLKHDTRGEKVPEGRANLWEGFRKLLRSSWDQAGSVSVWI